MSERLIRLPEVLKLTTLSRASVYAYVKRGKFPAPWKLGHRSVAWKESEVIMWIESRPYRETAEAQAATP